MNKQLLLLATIAFLSSSAICQSNDTISKAKASGTITMGVRDSSGALRLVSANLSNLPAGLAS
jgi:glutamate/aspartate transport system substrate-binding protein